MIYLVKFCCMGEMPFLLGTTLLPRLCGLLVKFITFGLKPRLRLSSINNLSRVASLS